MTFINQCARCKHYLGRRNCKAFSTQIPLDVFQNDVRHNHVLEGQKGTTLYEVKDSYQSLEKVLKEQEDRILNQKEDIERDLYNKLHEIVQKKIQTYNWEKFIIKIKIKQYGIDYILGLFNEKNEFVEVKNLPSEVIEKIKDFQYLRFLEENYKSSIIKFTIYPDKEIKIEQFRDILNWKHPE